MIQLTDNEKSCIIPLLQQIERLHERIGDRMIGILNARGLDGNWQLNADGTAIVPIDSTEKTSNTLNEKED